jgi:mevalonate kinase
MRVSESTGSELNWQSHRSNGDVWFSAKFDLLDFDIIKTTDKSVATTLRQIFKAACRLNSDFLSKWKKYKVNTYLEFEQEWGMGSSSTLISCISEWADANPYILLFNTLGGSGYDIACARAEGPILYQLGDEELHIEHVDFKPRFQENLYFVYLGKKQSSDKARKHYYAHRKQSNGALQHISDISTAVAEAHEIDDFEKALQEHEQIISKSLHLKTAKEQRFADYWGTIKSLGAWGGDFILATSDRSKGETEAYFKAKGLETVFSYADLTLD